MRLTSNNGAGAGQGTDPSIGVGVNLVRAYSPTELRINENRVQGNCLLSADTLIVDWPKRTAGQGQEQGPAQVTDLQLDDLASVYELKPEILLIGTGVAAPPVTSNTGGRIAWPDRKVISAVMARGIGVEVMETGAACRTFNVLVSEDRRVVAALFLTPVYL